MTTNADPSLDPANAGTITGLLRVAFRKMMLDTDGMVPARVIAFNRDQGLVKVQPLIPMVPTQGLPTTCAPVGDIPILQIGAGGFVLNFPIKAGDLGFIYAGDRDTSNFMQSGGEAAPQTYRIKKFSHGVFIPAVMRSFVIAEENAECAVFQNENGTVYVALGAELVKIKGTDIKLDGNVLVTGTFTVEGATELQGGAAVSGGAPNALTVEGNQFNDGNIEATGSITPNVPP
jgi:hypothetical protein